jgi:hypothetical protein
MIKKMKEMREMKIITMMFAMRLIFCAHRPCPATRHGGGDTAVAMCA